MGVQAGHQDAVIGGGVEMMSRWPVEDGPVDFTAFNPALRERFPLVPQGISADLIATVEGFDREAVDAFALSSQQRAATAIAEGRFDRSVVPIRHADGAVALDRDEFPRPSTTMDGLAKLSPSFAQMGSEVFDGFATSFDDMARRRTQQSRRSITCTTPATRRESSTGRVRSSSPPPRSPEPTDCRARGRIVIERGRRCGARHHAHGPRAGVAASASLVPG